MSDRPDIPEEVERFSFEGYERYRVHPDGEWVRYPDYSDALMRAFHAIEGECAKARKQGAEEERERLREALRTQTRKLESQSVRMDPPTDVKTPVSAFVEFQLSLGAIFGEPHAPAPSEEDCGRCGGSGTIPRDPRNPRGFTTTCPDCTPIPSEPEDQNE